MFNLHVITTYTSLDDDNLYALRVSDKELKKLPFDKQYQEHYLPTGKDMGVSIAPNNYLDTIDNEEWLSINTMILDSSRPKKHAKDDSTSLD